MGEHLCEDCMFYDKCTPFEKQLDNANFDCRNYISVDFEDIIYYHFAEDGVHKTLETE